MRLLVILLSFYSFSCFAYQTARVVVPKATVYSDLKLTSPIGQIPFGKVIYVGDTQRRHRTVVSTIVAGKLCYIRIRELALEKDLLGDINKKLNTTEHDIDVILIKPTDKLNENNYVLFTGSSMSMGSNWESVTNQFGNTPSSMLGFKAIFEHRPEIHNWSWGAGIDFFSNSQESISLSMVAIEINLYYSVIPFFRLFTADIMIGTILSAAMTISTDEPQDYTGSLLGGHFGGQIRLFPYSQIGFAAGVKYVTLGFSGLDQIDVSVDKAVQITGVNGLEFFGGMSYKF